MNANEVKVMEIINWITEAYRINFEQLCAINSSGEGRITSKKDGDLNIIDDDFKYSENDSERFIPIRLIANQSKLYAEIFLTIPVDLSNTDEIDVLKLLGRMNDRSGSFCTYFDNEAKKLKVYAYLSYTGSYVLDEYEDDSESGNFEVMSFSNILLGAMDHAHYWTDKIQLLENPDFIAEDVFKLIDKKVKFEVIK